MIDLIFSLDADDRETFMQMTLCDPVAGCLAREYLENFAAYRGTETAAVLELIAWLVLAREACGVEGAGRA